MSGSRLCEFFAQASELDRDGRAALLAEIGAADADLAAQLERLLAADETGGNPLDHSPWRAFEAAALIHEVPPRPRSVPTVSCASSGGAAWAGSSSPVGRARGL